MALQPNIGSLSLIQGLTNVGVYQTPHNRIQTIQTALTGDTHLAEDQKSIGTAMYVLAWLAIMTLLGFWFKDVLDKQNNPNQQLQTRYDGSGVREVSLQRNKFGHYVTSGKINGHDVVFMLDTGATGVAIPDHIARKLKIERGQPFRTQTANGTATAYSTRLRTVSVGDIELSDIGAGISPGLEGDEVLLGMSFLRHIEFTQRGGTLTLKQYL
jgi:aspartyl protease family protein